MSPRDCRLTSPIPSSQVTRVLWSLPTVSSDTRTYGAIQQLSILPRLMPGRSGVGPSDGLALAGSNNTSVTTRRKVNVNSFITSERLYSFARSGISHLRINRRSPAFLSRFNHQHMVL